MNRLIIFVKIFYLNLIFKINNVIIIKLSPKNIENILGNYIDFRIIINQFPLFFGFDFIELL